MPSRPPQLAGLAAAGCSSSSSSSSRQFRRVARAQPGVQREPASVSGVTLHIGDQKGTGAEALLTAAGLIGKLPFKVAWSDFTSGPPMLQAMGAGSVDIGGVGDAPPVFAASGGEKIAIVGARQANPPDPRCWCRRTRRSPRSAAEGQEDRRGSGSSANYHLLTVLTKAGLTVHDVTLVNLQPAEALAAFSSGSRRRLGHLAAVRPAGRRAGRRPRRWPPGPPTAARTRSRSLLEGRRGRPGQGRRDQGLPQTLDKAYAWAATHPSAWAVAWGKAAGLPDQRHGRGREARRHHPRSPITSATVSSEQNLVNQFFAAGLIPTKVNIRVTTRAKFNDTVSGSS